MGLFNKAFSFICFSMFIQTDFVWLINYQRRPHPYQQNETKF